MLRPAYTTMQGRSVTIRNSLTCTFEGFRSCYRYSSRSPSRCPYASWPLSAGPASLTESLKPPSASAFVQHTSERTCPPDSKALFGDVEPPSRLEWAESPALVSPFFDGPRAVDVLDDEVPVSAGNGKQSCGLLSAHGLESAGARLWTAAVRLAREHPGILLGLVPFVIVHVRILWEVQGDSAVLAATVASVQFNQVLLSTFTKPRCIPPQSSLSEGSFRNRP